MTRDELIDMYFDWMYQFVVDGRYSNKSYRKLFSKLYDTEFWYTIPMDGNRAEDGVDLRYRFGHEYGIDDRMIASLIDDRPCSVLEMMLALAIRVEENLMGDPDVGDRTSEWFWDMLESLGIDSMDDSRFDISYVDYILDRFLRRQYHSNGEGGLFTVEDARNMQNMEIWYQMNFYLSKLIKEGVVVL